MAARRAALAYLVWRGIEAQAGLAPEEFLRRRVEQMLDWPDEQFRQAAAYVLNKNAELYRRLA
jgi:hypothetical protein